MELISKKCVPCEKGAPVVAPEREQALLEQLPDWTVREEDGVRQLQREFLFPDFASAMQFANQVAFLAEEEGHHPIVLLQWGRVRVTWWTFKIRGLHENDFIMAGKTDVAYSE